MWPSGSADTVCPRPSVTLTFDHLTLKLVCESHTVRNLVTLGLWVLELFTMYATDGRTDRQTDRRMVKSNAYCTLSYGRGHNKINNNKLDKRANSCRFCRRAGIQIGMDIFIVRNGAVIPYLRDGLHRDAQLPVLPPEVTRIEVTWMAEDDVVNKKLVIDWPSS